MIRPLTSMAFSLGPQSMFCASPGLSLIRNRVRECCLLDRQGFCNIYKGRRVCVCSWGKGLGGTKGWFPEMIIEGIFITYWIRPHWLTEYNFDLLAANTTNRKGFVSLLLSSLPTVLMGWGGCVYLNSFRGWTLYLFVIVVVVLIRKKLETPCFPLNAVACSHVSKSSHKLLQVVICSVTSLLLYW